MYQGMQIVPTWLRIKTIAMKKWKETHADTDGVYMEINTSKARYVVAQGKQSEYVNVRPFSRQGIVVDSNEK